MATKDKLTLVQIRYMEKRINAARDTAFDRLAREFNEARAKLPEAEERSAEELAKQIMMLHPTITRSQAASITTSDRWRYNTGQLASCFGLNKDWIENKEARAEYKNKYRELEKRHSNGVESVRAIATEATDAIYLGDASQLNTILSKMDKVKF